MGQARKFLKGLVKGFTGFEHGVAQPSASSVLHSSASISAPLLPTEPASVSPPVPTPALINVLSAPLPTSPSAPSPIVLIEPAPAPALTNVPTPPAASHPVAGTTALCLWRQALEKLRKRGFLVAEPEEGDIKLIQKLISEIEGKNAEWRARELSYKNSSGKKVLYVEGFLAKLKKLASIGDLAIQQNPNVVAMAWAGFRLLLEVGIAYNDNMEMISDSLEYLVSVLFCGEIYERLYSHTGLAAAEPLNRSLVDIYSLILEYLWRAEKFLRKTTAIRILESFSNELKKILESIQILETVTRNNADLAEKEARYVANLNSRSERGDLKTRLAEMQESMQNIQHTVMESYRKIEALWQYVEKKQRLEVLRWISDVKFGSHHSEFRNRRHPDTGTWLFQNQKFNDWEVLSSSPQVFWLRGDAGSGKTMLTSKVIDVLQEKAKSNHHALAYFYCYFQESTRSDPKSVLRAIVKQLCVAYSEEGLPASVMSIYKARERDGHSTGPLDLIESRNLITELLGKFSHTTIVIDALDECNEKTRGEMFRILKQIVECVNSVRIFVTSRNEGDIREMLFSMPNHYIDARDNSEDINKYIRAEVTRMCNERQVLKVDPALGNEIISALEDGAKGMFQWAHLQVLAIRDENTPGDIRVALQNLPEDLNATYLNILQRIERQSKTSHRRAVKVLKWVLCVQGVCSPETIRQALLFDSAATLGLDQLMDLSHILDICRNLVVYDKELGVLRFAHFSVKEFLQLQPEHAPEAIHTNIAKTCLTILCPSPGIEAHLSSVPDLLNYAVFNWAEHVRLSVAGGTALQRLWKNFLQPSSAYYITWIKRITQSKKNSRLQAQGVGVISPLWVACYYQLYDIFESLLNDGATPNCYNKNWQTPLSHASKHGYEISVKRLLEDEGVDVNSKDRNGQTPISLAAENGHENVVRILLGNKGVDMNSKENKSQRTPLSMATDNGHIAVVLALLENEGVDMNNKNSSGRTPLSWAVRKGHKDVAHILLGKVGVDVNSKDSNGRTPLSWAVRYGHQDVVQMLLRKEGVDVNSKDNNGRIPLSVAIDNGHMVVVLALLGKEGVDINKKNSSGQTPLLWAACNGYKDVAQILLGKAGVDVNSKDNNGQTPLSLAAENGDEEMVQVLLGNKRVGTNTKENEFQQTPLPWAAHDGHEEVVLVSLGGKGVDVNSRDNNDQTPLSLAAENGKENIVQMLLENEEVDVNSKENRFQRTPLSMAMDNGHKKVVLALLGKEGVGVDTKDWNDRNPLSWAVCNRYEDVVQMLLGKEGVDVNCKDKNGRTPLSWTAENGDEKMVQMLLGNKKVDVNIKDKNGQTPLSLAAGKRHAKVVQMLRGKGGMGGNS